MKKRQRTPSGAEEDLATNDPDRPFVERQGPPIEQPEAEEAEEEAQANAGIEREDFSPGDDNWNEEVEPQGEPEVVVTERKDIDVTLPHHNSNTVLHLTSTEQRYPEKLNRLIKDAGGLVPMENYVPDKKDLIPVEKLEESPSNPRKVFGELDGMVASIGKMGILQDLVVRPISGGKFEVVLGHRRFRAAKVAGLTAVPCQVRNLSDREVLEAQLAENIERRSLSELEEAEGLHRLHQDQKVPKDEIAKRVGKSKRWVETRIQLMKLGPEGRKFLLEDSSRVSIAILLAGIPSHKLQAEAVEHILKPIGPDKEPMSFRAAKEFLQENYTTELRGVAFDRKDDMLVPEAGPCTTCPKRSANNPELFADFKRADICTDILCFRNKMDAHWDAQKEKAKKEGKSAMSLVEGRKLFRSGTPGWDSPWVDLDAACSQDSRKRSWRQVLGEPALKARLSDISVAPDTSGNAHELLRHDDALEIAKAAGLKWAARASEQEESVKPTSKEEQERRQREADVQHLVENEALARAVKLLEAGVSTLSAPVLRMMCKALCLRPQMEVQERRGWSNEIELESQIEKMSSNALVGLLFELCVANWIRGGDGLSDELKAMCKVLRVDLASIEKAQSQAVDAEALFSKRKARA